MRNVFFGSLEFVLKISVRTFPDVRRRIAEGGCWLRYEAGRNLEIKLLQKKTENVE
jgi:hypothetical protein